MNRFWIVMIAMLSIGLMGARGCFVEVVEEEPEKPCDNCEPEPQPMCADLAEIDFGSCEMALGFGVVGGECQWISGCGAGDHEFFEHQVQCEVECLGLGGSCEQIEVEYYAAIEEASFCEANTDCQLLWGQCGSGLGGCYEVANMSLTQEKLQSFGSQYWDAGCTNGVCDCAQFNGAVVCRENRCDFDWTPQPTCNDLTNVEFGSCEMLLGVGVVDGQCTYISGCGSEGYTFFESMAACEEQCAPECATDADCVLWADYCGGCFCNAISADLAELIGTVVCDSVVQCFADPCMTFDARCVAGNCAAVENGMQ